MGGFANGAMSVSGGPISRSRREACGSTELLSSVLVVVPAGERGFVARLGLDPALAVGSAFRFPERCVALEVIHQKFRGAERGRAVLRGGDDEHDIVAGLEPAISMNDQARLQVPARVGFAFDARELCFGHAGIMFERHRIESLSVR